jgi:hypothetical protein
MDKKIEEKNEKQATPKDEAKPARVRIRQLPERPLGLIQGT